MKKKILSGVFALALLVATGYGVNKSMNSDTKLSVLVLSRVEALGQTSGEDFVITCNSGGQGACWVADFEPLPLGRYRVTCPYFSGRMQDNCMPGTYPI